MAAVILWIIGALINTLIGYFVGERRGRIFDGAVLGFCLGPLGWLITLFLEDRRIKCPHCAGAVLSPDATVCARCARDLRPAPKPVAQPLPPKRVCVAPRHVAKEPTAAITADERNALDSFEVKLSRE